MSSPLDHDHEQRRCARQINWSPAGRPARCSARLSSASWTLLLLLLAARFSIANAISHQHAKLIKRSQGKRAHLFAVRRSLGWPTRAKSPVASGPSLAARRSSLVARRRADWAPRSRDEDD